MDRVRSIFDITLLSSSPDRCFWGSYSSFRSSYCGCFTGKTITPWSCYRCLWTTHFIISHSSCMSCSDSYRTDPVRAIKCMSSRYSVCMHHYKWPVIVYNPWTPNMPSHWSPGPPPTWVMLPSPGWEPGTLSRCIFKPNRGPKPYVYNNDGLSSAIICVGPMR